MTSTSLTYTVDDGTTYNDTYKSRGKVSVPDLSCYYMEYIQDFCPAQVALQTVAHTYGEMILSSRLNSSYSDIEEVLHSRQDYQYYHRTRRNQQQVVYRFKEYNPNDTGRAYPSLTDRVITAEAKNCITYNEKSTDESQDPQPFSYVNPSDPEDNGNLTIPKTFLGREGTTYIYQGFHDPTLADLQSCGPRCLWMWAYKNPSGYPKDPSGDPNGPPEPSAFYKCPVNISQVFRGDPKKKLLKEHLIPDSMAKMAAASIALQGRYGGPPSDPSKQDYHSHQFYASG